MRKELKNLFQWGRGMNEGQGWAAEWPPCCLDYLAFTSCSSDLCYKTLQAHDLQQMGRFYGKLVSFMFFLRIFCEYQFDKRVMLWKI